MFLELFVAFLQAFVFMFLTTVFISLMDHHDEHGHEHGHDHAPGHEHAMRAVSGDTYVTTTDNENNALTGTPDYDMDYSVCDGDSDEPIEFNIFVDRVNKSAQPGCGCRCVRCLRTVCWIAETIDQVAERSSARWTEVLRHSG